MILRDYIILKFYTQESAMVFLSRLESIHRSDGISKNEE